MLLRSLPVLVLTLIGPVTAAKAQDAPATSRFLWADANRDGQRDAFILRRDGTARLILGLAGGGFADRTESLGLAELGPVSDAAWGDADGDGRLELIVVGAGGDARLFAQEERGTFYDNTAHAGLPACSDVEAAEWLDFDGDRAADLLLHTSRVEVLLRGDGTGGFTHVDLGLPELEPAPFGALPSAVVGETGTVGERARTTASGDSTRPAGRPVHGRRIEVRTEGGRSSTPPGGRTDESVTSGPGSLCLPSILDLASGGCLNASSVPGLGMLFPLSVELFVDAATGYVGLGTLTPESRLHVEGEVQIGTGHVLTSPLSSILGGQGNTVSAPSSVVVSGVGNRVADGTGDARQSVIVGGLDNVITSDATTSGGLNAFIGGGSHNEIDSSAGSLIVGGRANRITVSGLEDRSVIVGGSGNTIESTLSAIGGGVGNFVAGDYGVIPGGRINRALGLASFAAGTHATADHDGAFVWADSTNLSTPFESTAPDQFLILAAGGVGIGTNAPSAELDVAGDIHAAGALESAESFGPPLVVASSVKVTNLNADLLDGLDASAFSQLGATIEGAEVTDGTLTDADISGSAAIAGVKVVPDFGAQTITTTGSLGVGTSSPENDLHVRGAGSTGTVLVTPNVSDSNAELRLTENVSATLGAILRYNGATNDLEIRGQNTSGETGVHFFVDRDSGVAGLPTSAARLGIGTASPSGKLHVVDGAGGDDSVVLPANAIGQAEIVGEMGLAARRGSLMTFAGTFTNLAGRTITTPTSGSVFVLATVGLDNQNSVLAESCSTKIRWTQTGKETDSTLKDLPANHDDVLSMQGVFAVPAGSHTFQLEARSVGGKDLTARTPRLTVLFVPTAYGLVDTEN